MTTLLSRRALIRGTAATTCAVAASALPTAAAFKADDEQFLATLIDIRKCIGCEACVDACPEGVQTIGPRDEIVRRAHAIAEEIDGFVYGENENGGTNTLYVSPVPFALIDQAIETGQPNLRPVDDRMADGNNLAKAMLLAPLAGVAAALAKFFYHTKSST